MYSVRRACDLRSPAWSRRSATTARSTGSTSRSPRARSTASSGPTAPASRPRSASCSACCAPTAARRALLGGDPWRDAAALHRRLAYVPGDVTLWPNLTGGEVIDLLGRLRGGLDEQRRAELLERFELDPTKKGRAYSKGNRQKVALVAALASDVELLVLDEPTSGLDPLMEAVFRECVADERRRGPHRAALEPHPRRGRGAVRPGDDHPRRPDGRDRHARRAAPPHADHDRGRRPPTARHVRRAGRAAASCRRRSSSSCSVGRDVSLISRPPTLEELFLRHYAVTVVVRDPGAGSRCGATG